MYQSYYEVRITGKDIKRFIRKLYRSKVYIEDIYIDNKEAYLKLDKENYNKVMNIKTIYEIKIVRLFGIVRLIYLIKKYNLFLISLIVGYIIILFLSNIIFDVEVLHSKKEIRNLVLNELNNNGIKKYNLVKSFDDKEKIKNIILKENKDKIEWLEIERKGVKYIVRVEERIISNIEHINKPTNIVAKKDSIIKKIQASSGEIVKKVNDYVKKGDILISGNILKGEEIKNRVKSNGIVYGETWYKITVNMPYHYRENTVTNNKHKRFKLYIINKDISLFNSYKTYKEKEIFSINNSLLPISFKYVYEYQTNEIDKIYTKEEINIEGIKKGEEKLLSILNDDEYIISSKVLSSIENNDYVKVEVFYKVYENITEEIDIEDETPN